MLAGTRRVCTAKFWVRLPASPKRVQGLGTKRDLVVTGLDKRNQKVCLMRLPPFCSMTDSPQPGSFPFLSGVGKRYPAGLITREVAGSNPASAIVSP